MSAVGDILATRPPRNPWRIASRVLQGAALLTLVYLVIKSIEVILSNSASPLHDGATWWSLAGAGVVYILAHSVRALRLALLVGGWRAGLRQIAALQFMTAAVSLAAPLKLGEIYRVIELANVVKDGIQAVVIVWWERVLDAFVILALIAVVMIGSGTSAIQYEAVAAVIALFLTATAVVFWVAPDNLRRLSVLIIRRYESRATVPLLRFIDQVRRAILAAPSLIKGKIATLATLTAVIWILEVACFMLAFPMLAGSFEAASDALIEFLSSVVQGVTLVTAGSAPAADTFGVLPYLAATQGPLALIGLAAALHYLTRSPAGAPRARPRRMVKERAA